MPIIKSKIILVLLAIATLIFGTFYIWTEWNKSIKETSNQAINIAKTAELSFNLEKQTYQEIKNTLYKVVDVNKNIRFAYFLQKKGDLIYFIADSETPDSPDYSPPGQEFTEADPDIFQTLTDGKELITKPTTDRWGTWVSVYVPVHSSSGEVVAVFGMDYPANQWNTNAIAGAIQNGIILFIVIILIFAIYQSINNNLKTKENEGKFRAFSASVKDAVVIMDGKGLVTLWNKAAEDMFGYSEDEIMGKTFHDFIAAKEEHKDKTHILSFGHTGESEVIGKLIELPVKNKQGREFIVELSVSRVLINGTWHAIGIMRDITERKNSEEIIKKSEEKVRNSLFRSEQANKLMVGRELEMIKMKNEIELLKKQLLEKQ